MHMLLNLMIALTLLGGSSPAPSSVSGDETNEFVEFRFDPDPGFALVGEWQGEEIRLVQSVELTPRGLVFRYAKEGGRHFVINLADAQARYLRGQVANIGAPLDCRIALRIDSSGHVAPTFDYRSEADLASPDGHPCALETIDAIQQDGSVHHVSKALYITDVKKLVGYQASPGTLTIEENAVRFEVEPEVTEPYGLLMARRANGDLYFWLVPATH